MDSEQAIVDWVLEPLSEADRGRFQEFNSEAGKHAKAAHKSFDCSIMDIADDIAYGVHDLEDAIALGLVSKDSFVAALEDRCPTFLDALKAKYPNETENDVFSHMVDGLFGDSGSRKHFISRLVFHFITAVEYVDHQEFTELLVRFRARIATRQRDFFGRP